VLVAWAWIVGGLVVWLMLGGLLAVGIGRAVRLADARSAGSGRTAELPASRAPVHVRRAVPLPPIGVALAASAVALETCGFILRLNGATGPWARLLSMDAPFGLPRLFVVALFTAAAFAAVLAAVRVPARRTWWLAVAVVSGGIACVKAGGTVRDDAMRVVQGALGERTGVLLSVLAAGFVVAGLWTFTRSERRDRRRVLGALACYAVASVGLSAVSAAVPGGLAITATYLEESAEALAGVAFLMAVLLGAAPQLVLPASWRLRRSADAQTLALPDGLSGISANASVR
jgi:hypothetical protein